MGHTLKFAISASVAALLCGGVAIAQESADTPETADERTLQTVTVKGIRGSLKASLDVKRAANQIVDAVSAEDVGKFPDANVAESLQRITGVAIDRSGGEGQFITVRGLGPEFNTVLLNGRTIATDNDGREFSFDVLSSDIIQRAEVFKTATPDLQSGGIGSTVNIVTARPFDRPGTNFTASVAGTYDTLREETSPEITAVGSWTNTNNSFGVLLGASFSDRKVQEDSSFTNGFADRSGNASIPFDVTSTGLVDILDSTDPGFNGPTDAIQPLADGARVQQQVVHSRDVQDRERLTINGAAQFRPNDRMTFTLDGLYTEFDVQSFATQFSGFFSPPFIDPVIDENGTVVSFSRPGQEFATNNPSIAADVGLSQNDNVVTSNNRLAETYMIGGNLEWDVSDSLSLEFDVSASNAQRDGTDPFIVIGALAPTSPLIELPNSDGISTITNLSGLTDTSIQRLHFVNVERNMVEDDVLEFQANGQWDINRGPLAAISFGASFTDREKTRDNFTNFSPTQGGDVFCAYCGYNVALQNPSILSPFTFDGFLDDAGGSGAVPGTILGFSIADAFAELNDTANITDPNRNGLTGAARTANDADLIARRDAAGNSVFGFYTPEFNPGGSFGVEEEITSFYANTEWEGDFGGDLPWAANLGFRLAQTEVVSSGFDQPVLQFRETPGDTQLLVDFGPTTAVSVSNDYINFLPSANVKLEPTEDTVVRFSFSETVTRPTLTALGVNNVFGGRSNAPTSGGGNPSLEAFESSNWDASFEWYFSDVSYFSIAGFYKDFENFLEEGVLPIAGQVEIPVGNQLNPTGPDPILVDVTFQDRRTRNGETGSITGLELAYQRTFDGLPEPWDGLGAAANYTYVTSNIDRDPASASSDCDYNGLSPHSFNLSGFYEKNGLSARLAYNFRDEFLFECNSDFSEPRTREAFGQLDFSAAYDVGDRFQIFFEGINITDEDTRDYSRFENRFLTYSDTGSRYQLGVRATY
ncbi:MAG: TonB-dependent receptor [Pseudomonadota bacterium]